MTAPAPSVELRLPPARALLTARAAHLLLRLVQEAQTLAEGQRAA